MSLLRKLHDKFIKKSQNQTRKLPDGPQKAEALTEDEPIKTEVTQDSPSNKTASSQPASEIEAEKKKLEAMEVDFVSMASHELRTPITSLLGYLNTLNAEIRDKLSLEHRQFLDRSIISAQQILALVNNLLNVSKVERGAFSVTLKPVDWKKVLETAVAENKILASQKNISLNLKLPDTPLPYVKADELRTNEVLNNLINNAITYSKAGSKVDVVAKIDGKMMTTSVIDNGLGIPKEALPHLFAKFFRVQKALDKSSTSSGSGLGLYISKSIIELHNGKIWAESEEGKGSTFSFTLPTA